MADNDKGIEGRPPDPFVASRINDPGAPAPASFELSGLLGDSDRDGYRRLYLNTSLDYYVEFRTDDVLTVDSVSPDQPPFVGLDATRVTLNRDAQVAYVHSRPAAASDAFNVDARAGFQGDFVPDPMDPTGTITGLTPTLPKTPFGCGLETLPPRCELPTVQDSCGLFRCLETAGGASCWATQCALTCGNGTCVTCWGNTCQTCNEATCQTCDQATCKTCLGTTCRTCEPQCFVITENGVTCHTCFQPGCIRTADGFTCASCIVTQCNWNCIPTADGCLTRNKCPTVRC